MDTNNGQMFVRLLFDLDLLLAPTLFASVST